MGLRDNTNVLLPFRMDRGERRFTLLQLRGCRGGVDDVVRGEEK